MLATIVLDSERERPVPILPIMYASLYGDSQCPCHTATVLENENGPRCKNTVHRLDGGATASSFPIYESVTCPCVSHIIHSIHIKLCIVRSVYCTSSSGLPLCQPHSTCLWESSFRTQPQGCNTPRISVVSKETVPGTGPLPLSLPLSLPSTLWRR